MRRITWCGLINRQRLRLLFRIYLSYIYSIVRLSNSTSDTVTDLILLLLIAAAGQSRGASITPNGMEQTSDLSANGLRPKDSRSAPPPSALFGYGQTTITGYQATYRWSKDYRRCFRHAFIGNKSSPINCIVRCFGLLMLRFRNGCLGAFCRRKTQANSCCRGDDVRWGRCFVDASTAVMLFTVIQDYVVLTPMWLAGYRR